MGVCIRVVDYSETSQIVTFFTKANGKISTIAKGSKRPKSAFDGPIEMFSFGEIVFSDTTKEKLAALTEFQQHNYASLTNNLFAFNCCLFADELLNRLTDNDDPHPELFDSFLLFLQNVNEQQTSISGFGDQGSGIGFLNPVKRPLTPEQIEHQHVLSLLILFQLTLLMEVGLMPILNACANCKTKYEHRASGIEYRVYFSSSDKGLICRDCQGSFPDKIKLSGDAAACLINLERIAQAPERTLHEIEKILISHFTELLGYRPKMAKHILKS